MLSILAVVGSITETKTDVVKMPLVVAVALFER